MPLTSAARRSQQPAAKITYCEGSPSWNPDAYLADAEVHARAEKYLSEKNDLRSAIATSFSLRKTDNFVYHAIVAVTLAQMQQAVDAGRAHGLHNWYYGEPPQPQAQSQQPQVPDGAKANQPSAAKSESKSASTADPKVTPSSSSSAQPSEPVKDTPPRPRPQRPPVLPPPPQADIEAYLSLFSPSNSAATALRNLASNAKKGSLRHEIGSYLTSKRFIHPSLPSLSKLPRVKANSTPALPANPYLTFLSWASRNLEWAGPCPSSERGGRGHAHHVLPVLMHHFGCVCPSYEALEILRLVADGREILDVGSGNGYWTRMLRDYHAFHAPKPKPKTKSKPSSNTSTSKPNPEPTESKEDAPLLPKVTPIDSAQSSWRTLWVPDTLVRDGASYIRDVRRGARDSVLLLVYPIVGGSGPAAAGGPEGGFTRSMLDAYEGDTFAVVGTQNHNGYTAFRNLTVDEFMEKKNYDDKGKEDWVKVVQIPLPSFPGKDEALFVFQRGARAPPRVPATTTTTTTTSATATTEPAE
ncbi:hypothetical protein F5Y17DRAFT_180618 [Xylariaceae sp. FL0594]|nr:hypothetical protein F5Y17DRAFT_180618 [Xylariaceae sp. FL0594]